MDLEGVSVVQSTKLFLVNPNMFLYHSVKSRFYTISFRVKASDPILPPHLDSILHPTISFNWKCPQQSGILLTTRTFKQTVFLSRTHVFPSR